MSHRYGGPQGRAAAVINGQLLHDDGRMTPLHNVRVELWLLQGGRQGFIGRAITGSGGRFEVRAELPARVVGARLILKLLSLRPPESKDEPAERRWRIHAQIESRELKDTAGYDFKRQTLSWWEYRTGPEAPERMPWEEPVESVSVQVIPRLFVPPEAEVPEELSPGLRRQTDMARGAYTGVWMRHQAAWGTDKAPTLEAVLRDYPQNLTRTADSTATDRSRSDDWLGDRVLSGFGPLNFHREPDDAAGYHLALAWSATALAGRTGLPDVSARFEERNDRLMPTSIAVGFPGEAPVTVEKGGPNWDNAKQWLRDSLALHLAVDLHLAKAHLDVEQYAMAFHRHLRANPVAELLAPHLKEVVAANRNGEAAFDAGFGPRALGLGREAVDARCLEVLGTCDWSTFMPRAPIEVRDFYGRIGRMLWEVIGAHVEQHLAEHRRPIEGQWREIRMFSDEIVQRSAPWRETPARAWVDAGEVDATDLPRVEKDGVLRAIRPITVTDSAQPDDWARLTQCLKYIIFKATFWHGWVHDRVWEDGGDPRYASPARARLSGLTPAPLAPEVASEQLLVAGIIGSVKHGRILANEEGDVSERLVAAVQGLSKGFESCMYDAKNVLRSRVNG
jgi:hypothetical protein